MKKLFVLYGEESVGKTTTLRRLFELLTGYKLTSKRLTGDFRIVFTVGNKTILIASWGDSRGVIKTNFRFFKLLTNAKAIIYKLDKNGDLVRASKSYVQSLTPDICITACRIYKDGTPNDIFDEVNNQIMDCMPIKDGIQWITKTGSSATGAKRKVINNDYETALVIMAEILKETIV